MPLDSHVNPSSAIGTTFEFERLAIRIGAAPYDICGFATVVADRRSWRVTGLSIDIDGEPLPNIKLGTKLFEQVRVALHRQCGEQIAERLNGFVEERGGYEILYGEAMPADPAERGRRHAPANDEVWWIGAA